MKYYLFLENGKLNGAGQCKQLTKGITNIEVTEEIYNKYIEKPKFYIYQDGQIVENPDYETELASEKETQFNSEFFKTSLGYIRRKVTMASGETKDFLSDLLPVISLGVQSGQAVTIITYNEPDFTQDFTQDLTTEYMETLQESKTVTSDFIQECFLQLSNDFIGG